MPVSFALLSADGSQKGVGAAVRAVVNRSSVFLQTKVPGCTGAATTCAAKTASDFQSDLDQLGLPCVDSVLLHGPPGPHGAACKSEASCAAAAAQWGALEKLYAAKKTRSIGVSNYCATCIDCLARSGAKIVPHINQIQYHAGMPGADPTGLISFCERHQIVAQAVSCLTRFVFACFSFSVSTRFALHVVDSCCVLLLCDRAAQTVLSLGQLRYAFVAARKYYCRDRRASLQVSSAGEGLL